jgi:hypothetical protein
MKSDNIQLKRVYGILFQKIDFSSENNEKVKYEEDKEAKIPV